MNSNLGEGSHLIDPFDAVAATQMVMHSEEHASRLTLSVPAPAGVRGGGVTVSQHCDVAIVGAGAAGAILAARLSEDPSCRVALIEAGKDTPPGAVPADIDDIFPRAIPMRNISGRS